MFLIVITIHTLCLSSTESHVHQMFIDLAIKCPMKLQTTRSTPNISLSSRILRQTHFSLAILLLQISKPFPTF